MEISLLCCLQYISLRPGARIVRVSWAASIVRNFTDQIRQLIAAGLLDVMRRNVGGPTHALLLRLEERTAHGARLQW